MIKMTWLQLAEPGFLHAVHVLWDCQSVDAQTSYTLRRIKQKLEKVEKDVQGLRMKIIDEYCHRDEKGEKIIDGNGNITFADQETAKRFEAHFLREFTSREVELKVSQIPFGALAQVRGLTPRHWEYLEPLVSGLPGDEEDEAPTVEKLKLVDGQAT